MHEQLDADLMAMVPAICMQLYEGARVCMATAAASLRLRLEIVPLAT